VAEAGSAVAEIVSGPEAGSVPAASAEDDLRDLEAMNWAGETIRRFRLGSHPDPQVEALLKRRLDLAAESFLGPYPLRLLCTLALVFAGCAISWILLWAVGTAAGWTVLVAELSYAMPFLLVVLFGISLSQPLRLYDETAITKAGEKALDALRAEIEGADGRSNRLTPNESSESPFGDI